MIKSYYYKVKGKKMIPLGNAIILLVLAMVLFLAVLAIIRGYKGMKNSKHFNDELGAIVEYYKSKFTW